MPMKVLTKIGVCECNFNILHLLLLLSYLLMVHVRMQCLIAFIFICAFIESNFSACKALLIRTRCIYSLESQEGNIQ